MNSSPLPSSKDKPFHFSPADYQIGKVRKQLLFSLTVACLTGVVGYRFYNQPKLSVGTISPIAIEAPKNGRFEDLETTKERRAQVRAGTMPVLRRNLEVTTQAKLDLATELEQLERLRQVAGPFPLVDVNVLSLDQQQYLRSCPQSEWDVILKHLKSGRPSDISLTKTAQYAAKKLQIYRQRVSAPTFQALLNTIVKARQQYAKVWEAALSQTSLERPIILEGLLMSPQTWQTTKKGILTTAQKILTQGIAPGISQQHLKETIAIQMSDAVPPSSQSLASELLLNALHDKTNLEEDREATQQQAVQAMEAVSTVVVEVKQGDAIVQAGEEISQADFILLDEFGLSRRGINWMGLGGSSILVISAVSGFYLLTRTLHRPMRHRDYILLSMLSVTTIVLEIAGFHFTNLPAVGLLTSSFYGPTLAVTQVIFLSGLSAFSVNAISLELVAGTAGGLLAAFLAGKLRSRDELSLLGVGVALVQAGSYLIGNSIVSAAAGSIFLAILPPALIYGLSGLAWCIVALGISPYLERFFDLITPIRLAELSNPNCPLIQRLATEAPGTFQHTLFVACLAEAAARKLHCNVELIRAGTLYHDIGKMHDPLSFIENQMGRKNKHDTLNDPWLSADIIKKHVSEGLVMAKRYGLPRVIRDFIPEHQGTLPIAYFYHQARQKAEREGKPTVNEADFCYDGPIPQSRETGIVMLADSCEAALRSLKDATPETAMITVKKIFQARWREHQLKDSGIRQEELSIIAEVFVQVWQQFHHQRIAYPKEDTGLPSHGRG